MNNMLKNLNANKLISGALTSGGKSSALLGNVIGNMKSGNIGKVKFNVAGMANVLSYIMSKKGSDSLSNYVYHYTVTTYQLIIEGEKPINLLGNAIMQVIITKNYDEFLHPIMEVVSKLPPKVHQLIKDNKQTAQIRLRIQKAQYNKSNELIRKRDWINDVFQVIMDDESDFKDKDEYDAVNRKTGNGDKYTFNVGDYSVEYTLSLWKKSDLDAMRSMVNEIFSNSTVSTALANIYSKAGIKKILISPLDNDKSYSEIRIKPMNLMNIPQYIEKVYGTYYTGSCVFLDYRCLYFLSKNGVCDAKEKGEYTRTIFRIPKSDKSDKHRVGTMKDSKNKFYYIYLAGDQIDFGAPSNSNDMTEGNNFSVVDPKNNETTSVTGAGEQSGSGNSRIVEDNYNNEFNKSTMISDVVEASKIAVINLFDYDEDALTPNKEFVIAFDDETLKDKNGLYRLIESQVVLNKAKADLEITGSHKFAFKQNISVPNAEKSSNNTSDVKVENVKTMSDDAKNSDANKTAAGASTTGKDSSKSENHTSDAKFQPSPPKPKTAQANNAIVNVTGAENQPKKNQKYSYDDLGNLKGIDIPSYNRVTANDTITVSKAKILKQQQMLPSDPPRPRLK